MAITLKYTLDTIFNTYTRVEIRDVVNYNYTIKVPKRFSFQKKSPNKVVVPFGNNHWSKTINYCIDGEYSKIALTIESAVIKGFCVSNAASSLFKFKIKKLGTFYIGKGTILDCDFNPIIYTEDVYKYRDESILNLEYRIVKINPKIYNADKEIFKFINLKFIPTLCTMERTYVPVKIVISDSIENDIIKPELYKDVFDISEDINSYMSENFA